MGIRVYQHYCINGYPSNIPLIVSDEGYGKMTISKLPVRLSSSQPRVLEAENGNLSVSVIS